MNEWLRISNGSNSKMDNRMCSTGSIGIQIDTDVMIIKFANRTNRMGFSSSLQSIGVLQRFVPFRLLYSFRFIMFIRCIESNFSHSIVQKQFEKNLELQMKIEYFLDILNDDDNDNEHRLRLPHFKSHNT